MFVDCSGGGYIGGWAPRGAANPLTALIGAARLPTQIELAERKATESTSTPANDVFVASADCHTASSARVSRDVCFDRPLPALHNHWPLPDALPLLAATVNKRPYK